MHITTQLDLDVIAIERDDQLSLLVELTAPTPEPAAERSPRTLVVVLDRSGSMAGERLDGAKAALTALVDRLDPADRFGLVTFDDEVRVEIAAAPMTDKHAAKQRIAGVQPGDMTNLSAGYLRGLQEAQRAKTAAGAAVLLISDGHANAGITDAEQLRRGGRQGQPGAVTTSTLGFGLGYDETLMRAIAAGGTGSELFAEHADDAMVAIAGEIDGLLAQIRAGRLGVHPDGAGLQTAAGGQRHADRGHGRRGAGRARLVLCRRDPAAGRHLRRARGGRARAGRDRRAGFQLGGTAGARAAFGDRAGPRQRAAG